MLRVGQRLQRASYVYIHSLRRMVKHQTVYRLKPLTPSLFIAPTETDIASYENRVLYVKNLPFHLDNNEFLPMFEGLQSVHERDLSHHKTTYRVLKFASVNCANNAWAWLQSNRLYIHSHAVQVLSDHVVSYMLDMATQHDSPYEVRRKRRGRTIYSPLMAPTVDNEKVLYVRISGVPRLVDNFADMFQRKLSKDVAVSAVQRMLLGRRVGTDLEANFEDPEELQKIEQELLAQLMKTQDSLETRDDLSVYVSRRKFTTTMWVKLDQRISSTSLQLKMNSFSKKLPRAQRFDVLQTDSVYTKIMENKALFVFETEDAAKKFYGNRENTRLFDKKVYSYWRNDAGYGRYENDKKVAVDRTIYFSPSGRRRLAESVAYRYIPGLEWYDRGKRILLFRSLIHANYFFHYYDKLLPIRWAATGTPEWTIYKSPHRAKTLDRGQQLVTSEEKFTKDKPDIKHELHDGGAMMDFG